jgi:ABC-2 type transport system permease protein
MRLNAGRVIRSATANSLRYSLLVLSVLLIGYISSLPSLTGYYDTTRFKDRTLTEESQQIVQQLNKPLTITTYVNIINSNAHLGSPKFRKFDKNQFEQYVRYLPGIKFDYIYYYDSTAFNSDKTKTLQERAQRSATAYGYDFTQVLSDKEIKKIINLAPEQNRFFRTVSYEGRVTPLRMFNDMYVYPHEPEISAALKRLIKDPKTVGIVQGNDERSPTKTGDKAYQNIMTEIGSRSALINNGFEVVNIEVAAIEPIPLTLAALVIADPMAIYPQAFMDRLQQYIDKGGNLLLAGEPGKQSIANQVAAKLGVHFMDGVLLQQSKNFSPDLVQASVTKEAKQLFPFEAKDVIALPGVVGLNYDTSFGYQVLPVLRTDKKNSWNKTGAFNLETDQIAFDPQRDTRADLPVALALSRQVQNKLQKIMIVGDADFMSNSELSRQNLRTENAAFTLKIFKWFSDNEYPIDAQRPDPIDNKITISKDGIGWMKMALLGFFPACFLLAGGWLIVSRKRK